MEQWEYSSHIVNYRECTIDGQRKAMDPGLDELGKQGWELVAAVDTGNSYEYRLFFKRRLAG